MATINKTIAKTGSVDANTIQGGLDLCLDDGNDYVLTIMDHETYTEQAVLAARPAGGTVTLQAESWGASSRPTITYSGADGALLELRADHIVKGIRFVYDEDDVGQNKRMCIYVPSGYNLTYSEVAYNQMMLGGRYIWNPGVYPYPHWGHCGYFAEDGIDVAKFYNNLVRRAGFEGLHLNPDATDTWDIYNNTFIKCQESIVVANLQIDVISVWNNIFDIDPTWGQCAKYYAILIDGGPSANPTRFKLLDNNLYFFRNAEQASETWVYYPAYERLANLQAVDPSIEPNGLEADPKYCKYCEDYHLRPDSPAIDAGSVLPTYPLDDNDTELRSAIPDIGAFEAQDIAYVEITVAKKEYSDYCTIMGAVEAIPEPVDCHYQIKVLDVETYDEEFYIEKEVTTGSITIVGYYNGFQRTRLINSASADIITIASDHIGINDFWIDLRRCDGVGIKVLQTYERTSVINNYLTAGCPDNNSVGVELMGENDLVTLYNNHYRGFAGDAQVVVREPA